MAIQMYVEEFKYGQTDVKGQINRNHWQISNVF